MLEGRHRVLNKDALFRIPKGEMESGIFYDIEQAIARPGEEIDQLFREYHTHLITRRVLA